MKNLLQMLLVLILLSACSQKEQSSTDQSKYLVDQIPLDSPISFKPKLTPDSMLIHRGVFSPDLSEYYYTVSDKRFNQFDMKVIHKKDGKWTKPSVTFFNSNYNEHGMSFSPDGNELYFSSTRPTNVEGVMDTWHIWKSKKVNGSWSEPEFIDLPNMRDKLVSHPSVANSGTIYFHASKLDYSEMDIYYAPQIDGVFENAMKLSTAPEFESNKCTPYISPDESYLIYALIGEQLDLAISFKNESGDWINSRKLNGSVNTNGQGNPYVTPDGEFLFFATGKGDDNWSVKWISMEALQYI